MLKAIVDLLRCCRDAGPDGYLDAEFIRLDGRRANLTRGIRTPAPLVIVTEDGKSYVDTGTYRDGFRTYLEGHRTALFRSMGE